MPFRSNSCKCASERSNRSCLTVFRCIAAATFIRYINSRGTSLTIQVPAFSGLSFNGGMIAAEGITHSNGNQLSLYLFIYARIYYLIRRWPMKQRKMLISLPESMKQQLDALRAEGYTVSGYIRHVVKADLKRRRTAQKGGGKS